MMLRSSSQPLDNHVRRWLYLCALFVGLMIVIGGITRLTGSGLSMTSWNPVTNLLPPLNQQEWQKEFEHYQQFPEYHSKKPTLDQFKVIYLIEYGHRLWGRLLGLMVFFPFLWFFCKRKLRPQELTRMPALFLLGLLQGFIGWWMVKSGLRDVPEVSHLRLGVHFSVALVIFAALIVMARDIKIKSLPCFFILSLFATMMAGSLVAGLKAGHIYNSFPLMNGEFFPDDALALKPFYHNLTHNPVLWQWGHRMLATLTLILAWRNFMIDKLSRPSLYVALAVTGQFTLGAVMLVLQTPLNLAIIHQAWGVFTLALALWMPAHEQTR